MTSLDVCQRKPIVATAGLDCSIRVWNYVDNTLELSRYFSEEVFSLALHPSGLFLLAGFGDKLRLLNLLMDDIRPVREFSIRECKECRFSQGGHMFAAAQGNIIQVGGSDGRGGRGEGGEEEDLFFPLVPTLGPLRLIYTRYCSAASSSAPHLTLTLTRARAPLPPPPPALLDMDLPERGQPQGAQRARALAVLVRRRHKARLLRH